MERQKRIALVNDITGFGRCSITVELPLISALQIETCPFPTAILSVHTAFPTQFIDDYTDRMRPYMENWKENGVTFDGICTGFIGSAAQIRITLDFISLFRRPETLVIVDPVMGDDGKLYASYTDEMCREMGGLLTAADLVTPNLTEACRLLDRPYPEGGRASADTLFAMAEDLAAKGPRQVVITGIRQGEEIWNILYEKGRAPEIVKVRRAGEDRPGTGDAFAAIVAGSVVKGETLSVAVRKAADFISRVLVYTEAAGIPKNQGLAFERYLTELR